MNRELLLCYAEEIIAITGAAESGGDCDFILVIDFFFMAPPFYYAPRPLHYH